MRRRRFAARFCRRGKRSSSRFSPILDRRRFPIRVHRRFPIRAWRRFRREQRGETMDYLYDGTFEGMLCCVYAHYYQEKAQGIFPEESYQRNLFQAFCTVETNGERAARVYNAVKNKISGDALRRIYAVWLSCESEKEMKILRYLELGFRMGAKVDLLHGNSDVYATQQAEKKVYNERHRLLGLLRFSVIRSKTPIAGHREILYAKLEPDNDVIELLASHFANRYKNDPLIIHDARREKALFAGGGHWYTAALPRNAAPEFSENEVQYRALWKQYFETIAIRERTNPRCQRQYMPTRYWKYLTELQSSSELQKDPELQSGAELQNSLEQQLQERK